MKDLKKKIAIVAAVAMLSSVSAFAADEQVDTTVEGTDVIVDAVKDVAEDDAIEVTEDAKEDASILDAIENIAGDEITLDTIKDVAADVIDDIKEIKVMLNDKLIEFDVQPQIIEGRTLVPLRAIFEAIGAKVDWDDATKTVTAVKDDITITMTIDKFEMTKNDTVITLDVAPIIIDERTMVPVRAIAESFDKLVDWDDATKTVLISEIAKDTEEVAEGDAEVVEDDAKVVEDGAEVVEDDAKVVEDDAEVVEDDAKVVEDDAEVVEDDAEQADTTETK